MALDPVLAELLKVVPPLASSGDPAEAAAIRQAYRARLGAAALDQLRPQVAETVDRVISHSGLEVPVRIYRPHRTGSHGTFVYYHGGGWVLGDLESHDILCRTLCLQLDMTVVAVDYRLAPENPFPAGLSDALAATRWALRHIRELGNDHSQFVVGGDSAGANFAAVIAQELRDEPISAQWLIYPATDLSRSYPSDALLDEGYVLTHDAMRLFENSYFPNVELKNDPRISPLRADRLDGLAPAIVITAALDPLKDQGHAYADALRAAGNTVVSKEFPTLCHGFVTIAPVVPAADKALTESISALRDVLEGKV